MNRIWGLSFSAFPPSVSSSLSIFASPRKCSACYMLLSGDNKILIGGSIQQKGPSFSQTKVSIWFFNRPMLHNPEANIWILLYILLVWIPMLLLMPLWITRRSSFLIVTQRWRKIFQGMSLGTYHHTRQLWGWRM